jgi:hypothetical protein
MSDLTCYSTPAIVYRSYLAAVWEELWAFDKDRHMMENIQDLAGMVDIVRQHFTSSREDLIQLATVFAERRGRAVQSDKVRNRASNHSKLTDKNLGICFTGISNPNLAPCRLPNRRKAPWKHTSRPNTRLGRHGVTLQTASSNNSRGRA